MRIFRRKRKETLPLPVTASEHCFGSFQSSDVYRKRESELFKSVKENVPIINAAIAKIVRLVGEFSIETQDKSTQRLMDNFISSVKVNSSATGLDSFLSIYLEQLLSYGTAVGEMVLDNGNSEFVALYNTELKNISLKECANPLGLDIRVKDDFGMEKCVENPERILITALHPQGASPYGESILKGLPYLSDILMKIYNTIGKNWERVGDVRFAVTYKPGNDATKQSYSRERAKLIATEWSKAMNPANKASDFVAVGDVDIKVIGADNQILDSSTPVRQLLEQIVSKLSIPPFLLGLSWSTTERMSSQQADILTSELDAYRRLLNPVIRKICDTYLHINGIIADYEINWAHINLQDEVELASARLTNAQAEKTETEVMLLQEENK